MAQVKFEIQEEIAELSHTFTRRKLLSFVSWNDEPAKFDIRTWRKDDDGSLIPGKGITLTRQEAAALANALAPLTQES